MTDGPYERLDWDEGESIGIGHGVTIRYVQWRGHNPAGLIEEHDRPDNGRRCLGTVLFDLPGIREAFPKRHVWQVQSLDPLTLTPSLACSACGHHGFIRAGQWVPV